MRPGAYARGTRSEHRLLVMFAVGAVVAVAIGFSWSWWYAPVAGWAAACLSYLAWVWTAVWRLEGGDTRTHATREDPNRAASDLLVLIAGVVSLGAVGIVLVHGQAVHGASRAALAGLALISVALSWMLIHTLYALRYARIYFHEPEGGIDFNQDAAPQYTDFFYLAFNLGMTYQISDTTLHSTELRKVVLGHVLLSYLFGVVVLATAINLVVGLG